MYIWTAREEGQDTSLNTFPEGAPRRTWNMPDLTGYRRTIRAAGLEPLRTAAQQGRRV